VLLYGIDSEILEVVGSLQKYEETSLNPELAQVLEDTGDTQLKEEILSFFAETEFGEATDYAVQIVADPFDVPDSLVTAALRYLASVEAQDAAGDVLALAQQGTGAISRTAIRALGSIGGAGHVAPLLEMLHDVYAPSETRSEVILALGELGSTDAVEPLIQLVADPEEESVLRRYACDALGKIGDDRAVPVLKDAFSERDTWLRAYAVYALAQFDDPKTGELLMRALKDSFWRVRVSAAKGLADLALGESVPILTYKAERDPVMKVRVEAAKALAAIGTEDAVTNLQEIVSSERTPLSLRIEAIQALVHQDLSSHLSFIMKTIEKDWEDPDSRLVERVCHMLSQQESPKLRDPFDAMLSHPSFVIRIYGVRGIARNGFQDLRADLRALTAKGVHRSLRSTAVAALETLGTAEEKTEK
jgi:HEAT repeat protein